MSSTPALLLLSVALGAASAGLTTAFLVSPSADEPTATEAVRPETDVVALVSELRAANAELRARVKTLEERPISAPRVALTEDGTRFDAFEKEVRAWMAQEDGAGVPLKAAVVRDEVEDALGAIREQERLEREQVALQRRDEWIAGRVQKLAPRLGLDPRQQEEMRTILTTRAEADAELKQAWQAGGDAETLGETKRANNEEFVTSLGRVLSAQQLEDYLATERGGK